MSYLGSDTASGVIGFIGTTATSIINLITTRRAVDANLSLSAYGRQTTMSNLVEGQEYSQYQRQMAMEEARAQAEVDWAVESALREKEKQVQEEIAATYGEMLHTPRPVATYGEGRPTDDKLWWILGIGGLGLVVGATFLISKAGD
jgi:hypothetical protein